MVAHLSGYKPSIPRTFLHILDDSISTILVMDERADIAGIYYRFRSEGALCELTYAFRSCTYERSCIYEVILERFFKSLLDQADSLKIILPFRHHSDLPDLLDSHTV